MRAQDLGERDDWTCWLCGGAVDPAAPAGSPGAGTVDHVVPRSRGGGSDAGNLRLAHRRCNGHRGSHLPELAWPADLAVVDAVPLWQALARLARRAGSRELVALLPGAEAAAEAAAWVTATAARFLGGEWDADVVPTGAADGHLHALHLGAVAGSAPRPAGRPRLHGAPPGGTRRGRASRRRRR